MWLIHFYDTTIIDPYNYLYDYYYYILNENKLLK